MLEYTIHELNATNAHPTRAFGDRDGGIEDNFAADKFEQFLSVSRGITNIFHSGGKDSVKETIRHPVLDSMTTSSTSAKTAETAKLTTAADPVDSATSSDR